MSTWKRYPESKPPQELGIPHWESHSIRVLIVVDDGSPTTLLSDGRLHGLWDDGCETFVGEEWRDNLGRVVNVTHWKEYDPATIVFEAEFAALPDPIRRTSKYNSKRSAAELLVWPLLLLAAIPEAWRMAKEVWRRYLKP